MVKGLLSHIGSDFRSIPVVSVGMLTKVGAPGALEGPDGMFLVAWSGVVEKRRTQMRELGDILGAQENPRI